MKRKDFLKVIGDGTAVAAVAPSSLAAKPESLPSNPSGKIIMDVASIPDGMTLDDIKKEWNRTGGTILYQGTPPKIVQSDELDLIITDELYELKSKEANEKLIKLFEENPEVAEIIRDMTKGYSVRAALERHLNKLA